MNQDVVQIIKQAISEKEGRKSQAVAIVSNLVFKDPKGWVDPIWVKHLLEIVTGKSASVDDAVAALIQKVKTGYVSRIQTSLTHRQYVFVGASMRAPRTIMAAICRSFKTAGFKKDDRRAYAYYRLCDWKKFPKLHRQVWERHVLYGEYPTKMAFILGAPAKKIRAIITRHKTLAGVRTFHSIGEDHEKPN